MSGPIWAVVELGPDGLPTRLSLEAATAARTLATAAGTSSAAIITAGDPDAAASALASFIARVVVVRMPAEMAGSSVTIAGAIATVAGAEDPDILLVGATPEGRETAGILAARLGRGVLGNATGLAWSGGADGAPAGPRVEMSVLGGRALTTSAFADGRGIVTLRPGAVTAGPGDAAGTIEEVPMPAVPATVVRVVGRAEATTRLASIEEAPIVVTGGRGLGGPDGVALLGELAPLPSRSARRARPSVPLSTSGSASRARSSTGWACRTPRRSSRSTATRMRRSPSTPISTWWGTCSRSFPRSSRPSGPGQAEGPRTVPEALVVASLALFVALVIAFASVLRRAARVVAVTRTDDAFRSDGAALAERAAATITSGAERIDRVRRRTDAPNTLDDALPDLLEALEALRVEADALVPPAALTQTAARIAEELDRAGRAVETVRHGCVLLGVESGRPRELEGETSIKRGYLNLLHAREALASLAEGLRQGRAEAGGWYSHRPKAG